MKTQTSFAQNHVKELWYKAEYGNDQGTFYAVKFNSDTVEIVPFNEPTKTFTYVINDPRIENHLRNLGTLTKQKAEQVGVLKFLVGGRYSKI
jgi:hypothetical protein